MVENGGNNIDPNQTPRSAFCGIRSRSTLFAQVFLSEYLELIRYCRRPDVRMFENDEIRCVFCTNWDIYKTAELWRNSMSVA